MLRFIKFQAIINLMLTRNDLNQVREIVKEEIEQLPTKDEFFQMMDKVFGELRTIRDELKISRGRIDDHEERITSLENDSGRSQMLRDSEE